MKTILITALLIASNAFILSAQKPVVVKGTIEGIPSGKLYMLTQRTENQIDTLGTSLFTAPNFVIAGKISEPTVTMIKVDGYAGGFTLLAEPGVRYDAMLKNGDDAYIHGGTLQNEWVEYTNVRKKYNARKYEMEKRHEQLLKANKYRSASSLNDSLTVLIEKENQRTVEFLNRHDDLISAYSARMNVVSSDATLETTKNIYAALGDGAKNTPCGRLLKMRIERMEKTTTGSKAPDFTLNTADGKPYTLSAIPGKIKILDFWASWCGPCRMNNPVLRAIYDEYHSKGLEIVSVSLDDKKDKWTAAIVKDALPWIHISSLLGWQCPVAKLYNVNAVPAIFILDEQNNIIATNLRGDKLKAFIKEKID